MTRYLLLALLAVLIGYGLIEARALILGPTLSISSPQNNGSYPGGIVDVSGHASRTASLSIDSLPVLPDQNGSFSSTLTFPKGSSILTFVAADRFGRTITKTRTIFVP